jgi:hypothetical protein
LDLPNRPILGGRALETVYPANNVTVAHRHNVTQRELLPTYPVISIRYRR